MTSDGVVSLAQRMLSLEDIIRQQELTIGAVLQRLRDVEQYAAAESRSREQTQQHLYALLEERGGSTSEVVHRIQAAVESHSERLSALQAEVQGQGAALRDVNDKHDAALRGMEQRLQAEVSGAHHRALTGETASAEAIRTLQAQLQSMASAAQAIETRSHDDFLALQQQMNAEIAALRQRSDNLESAMRDALRDVHGSLSDDVRRAAAQQRGDMDGAVERIKQELAALDQRMRIDMNQLHSAEQTDISDLRRRIGDLESSLRASIQSAANGLANEMARVVQHTQVQDKRQATAHQAILQELAKHDSQIETVDLNWRGSVTDLSAKIGEDVAAAQQRSAARDQALQSEVSAVQDRFVATTDSLRRDLTALASSVQENSVKPMQEVQSALGVQEQRLGRIADDCASMQEYLKTFAAHVDDDVAQLKQVTEAAVRAAHADMLERLQQTSASVMTSPYSEMLHTEVNRGLAKLWDDAKSVFVAQRSFSEVQTQLSTLESAVRVELCALAEHSKDVWRSLEELRAAHLRATQQPTMAAPATRSPSRAPQKQDPAVAIEFHKTATRQPATAATAATAGPSSSTLAKVPRATSDTATVEEIDRDDDEQNERPGQHEEDIKGLRASLQPLRTSQAPGFSNCANLIHAGSTSIANDAAAAATATRFEDASREANAAALEAAESARTARIAQEESVRVVGEVRLALERVDVLEGALQKHLKQLRAMRAAAAPAQQDQPPPPSPRSPLVESGKALATLSETKVPRSSSASLAALTAREAEREHRVGDTTALVKHPNTPDQLRAHRSLRVEALTAREADVVEVPGSSTGEVFLLRQDRTDCRLPARVQVRPATTGARTIPRKSATSSDALLEAAPVESALSKSSPSRGSNLAEVLLPTYQFVRKREFTSFKDFIKREIDSVWAEVMKVRRAGGLSKEELLLYMSQNKEQMLSTVLKIIQQQEEEMLGVLSSIKAQLTEVQRSPDLVREIRVFPIDSGQHLEGFVRSLSSNLKAAPLAAKPAPPSTATIAAEPLQGRAQKALSRSATQRPATPRAQASNAAITAPSGQLLLLTPRCNRSVVDSGLSSECSSVPLQPQLIPPIVRRGVSPPRLRPEQQEVLYVSIDEMGSPKLSSSPHCEVSHYSAARGASWEGQQSLQTHTKDVLGDPKAAAPAPHLLEPTNLTSKHHPAGMPSTSVPLHEDKHSPSTSVLISAARPPSLGSLRSAASAGTGTKEGREPGSDASSHMDRTAPAPHPLRSCSKLSADGCHSLEEKRYLKESKSPRNPTGSSYHLNPLHEIEASDFSPPTEPTVRLQATSTAAPSPVVGARAGDRGRPLLEEDSRQPAVHVPPSSDAALDKCLSVKTSEGSDIYFQSVESTRPPRSCVRRRPAGAGDTVPARQGASPSSASELGHLYKLPSPISGKLRAHSPPFSSPMLEPPQRDRWPAPDQGNTSVKIDPDCSSDIIHLGPCAGPAGDDPGDRSRSSEETPSNVFAVRVLDSSICRVDDASREGHSSGMGIHLYREL
ncbi:hypothetical protein LSCM1_05238 [Leishmania martiniquensis]|uniref:Uncharacterized protein n=1 Tax=Leishmania martiniquensis TaxID=1580590 RepID=A0A836HFK7_9TRYP|nr:hypothetical protein LSCM1_05238 [Leishmania martiniquensis]